jgi:large subunit ribosomal protein L23
MGLFGTKKSDAKKETSVSLPKAEKVKTPGTAMPFDIASAIIKPRITEKAALLLEKNVYTFEIPKGASKFDVRDAVVSLYKVTPTQIRIVNQAPRRHMSKMRGREMLVSGKRKAYVYLKKGDRIDLV